MGRLSTHVLDTTRGRPAAAVRIELFALDGDSRRRIAEIRSNADGRTDRPLLEGDAMRAGTYELVFHIGDYFRASGMTLPSPAFVDVVPIRFGIAAIDEHYHVPLQATPWSFGTYRGS